MMEIVEAVAAKMAKQAECNHERKATGFGYACKGHYGAYSYCLDCDRTTPLHARSATASVDEDNDPRGAEEYPDPRDDEDWKRHAE